MYVDANRHATYALHALRSKKPNGIADVRWIQQPRTKIVDAAFQVFTSPYTSTVFMGLFSKTQIVVTAGVQGCRAFGHTHT